MTMIAQRIFAPSVMAHQQQPQVKSTVPGVRFSGSDVKNTLAKIGPKRLGQQPLAQFGTGPLPSIERRNARERNRVRQVNNGFDKLRQYIPARIVEAENGGRGVSKKLSKVDTLKMAVTYIQRLKEMLDESNGRLPETSASSYYSASPAPSSLHQHPLYTSYASTPLSHYQEHPHPTTCSEPSVSPAPSYHSDVSSQPQSVYQLQTAQFCAEGDAFPKGYSQVKFEDEDSGSFEEDGILDDILQWQMQS